MGTAERRLAIYRYLCRHRHATMPALAEQFGVSVRTIQRDIYEVEISFHLPIVTKAGKNGGGVYLLDTYTPDRIDKGAEELSVLQKAYDLLKDKLSFEELAVLGGMIKRDEMRV